MTLETDTPSLTEAKTLADTLQTTIGAVIRDQVQPIRWLTAAMIAGGHVLLEDFPGTGKTTLAKALAKAIDVNFARIQFTPDLLPSDILGVSIFDQRENQFQFHAGPVFTQVLLADEINRASPRTQSALLESMAEGQVTIEGKRHHLGELFFVIATQNPVEFQGTYALPEAQMDRFALKFQLGYITNEEESQLLVDHNVRHPLEGLNSVCSADDILHLRSLANHISLSDDLRNYIVALVSATRTSKGVKLGASPRASLALMKLSQCLALLDGVDYVRPDHIQEIASAALAHRLYIDPQSSFSGLDQRDVIDQIINTVPVPV